MSILFKKHFVGEVPNISIIYYLNSTLKLARPLFFYQVSIYSPDDSPSKTVKCAFYLMKEAVFVLNIFSFFFNFPLSFDIGTRITFDAMKWLA